MNEHRENQLRQERHHSGEIDLDNIRQQQNDANNDACPHCGANDWKNGTRELQDTPICQECHEAA